MAANQLAIASSDFHLQKYAWAKHPTLCGDSFYSLNQIVDYAVKHELDIFAAGDLIDKTYPDSTTVYRLLAELERLRAKELQVYYIVGQHEKVRDTQWMSLGRNTNHIHRQAFNYVKGVNIYGIDYTRPDQLQKEIDLIPKDTNILLMHQVTYEFMGNFTVTDFSFEQLPPIDVLLVGDFHQTHIRRCNTNNHKWIALSAGSLASQSIDEPADKYFFVLYDDLSVKKVKLKTRNVFRFVVFDNKELEKFLDLDIKSALVPQKNVPDNIQKNIIDVKFHPDVPNVFDRISKAVGDRAHLFPRKLKINKDKEIVNDQVRVTKTNLTDCLHMFCDNDSKLYDSISRTLKSNDPVTEIDVIAQEILDS